jgi:hypothetical protein
VRYQLIPIIIFEIALLAFGVALIANAGLRLYRGQRR